MNATEDDLAPIFDPQSHQRPLQLFFQQLVCYQGARLTKLLLYWWQNVLPARMSVTNRCYIELVDWPVVLHCPQPKLANRQSSQSHFIISTFIFGCFNSKSTIGARLFSFGGPQTNHFPPSAQCMITRPYSNAKLRNQITNPCPENSCSFFLKSIVMQMWSYSKPSIFPLLKQRRLFCMSMRLPGHSPSWQWFLHRWSNQRSSQRLLNMMGQFFQDLEVDSDRQILQRSVLHVNKTQLYTYMKRQEKEEMKTKTSTSNCFQVIVRRLNIRDHHLRFCQKHQICLPCWRRYWSPTQIWHNYFKNG